MGPGRRQYCAHQPRSPTCHSTIKGVGHCGKCDNGLACQGAGALAAPAIQKTVLYCSQLLSIARVDPHPRVAFACSRIKPKPFKAWPHLAHTDHTFWVRLLSLATSPISHLVLPQHGWRQRRGGAAAGCARLQGAVPDELGQVGRTAAPWAASRREGSRIGAPAADGSRPLRAGGRLPAGPELVRPAGGLGQAAQCSW